MIFKIVKWVLITFSLLFFLAVLLGDIPLGPTYEPTFKEVEDNPEPQPVIYSIGDRVVVGDIAYTVTNVRAVGSVGDYGMVEIADGVFLMVELEVENLGDETKTLSSSYVKAIDSQGRTFEYDNDAWIYLEDSLLLKQIQPGLPTKGETIFDVPEGESFFIEVSSGLWGENKLIAVGNT